MFSKHWSYFYKIPVYYLRQKMLSLTPAQATELIRRRRSIFPDSYSDRPISREIILEVLENANWAPTHRLTEPWRFRVFIGESRQRLSDYMADWYQRHTPSGQFSEKKLDKTRRNPLRAACVIAICMQRDPAGRVPEWEELAAVACAVQNMWLTCTAYGIGSYWSTPKSILDATELLELREEERCLGLFYMGYHTFPDLPGKRGPIAEKVTWME